MREWRKKNPEKAKAGAKRGNSKWRKANIAKNREINRQWYANVRKQAIARYGGKCTCCGETGHQFLTLDHINGDGAAHRKQIGCNLAAWLRRNGWPKGFRVLCWNCNCALGLHGHCH